MMDSMINSLASSIFTPEGTTVNPQYQPQVNTQDKPQRWFTEEMYAEMHTSKWMPKIEQSFKDGVLISQTIQYSPQGKKEPFPAKQWTDLTEDEMKVIWYEMQSIMGLFSFQEIAQAVQAKLKEKNAKAN